MAQSVRKNTTRKKTEELKKAYDSNPRRIKPLAKADEDEYTNDSSSLLVDFRTNAYDGETLGNFIRRREGKPPISNTANQTTAPTTPANTANPFANYSNVLGINRATSGGLGGMQKNARASEYETNALLNEFYNNYSAVDDSRKNELKQANWNAGSRLSERADIANRAEEDLLGYAMTNWDSDTSDAGYTRRLQEAEDARVQAAQALRESAAAQRELDTARDAEWFNERTEYYNSLRNNPDFAANSMRVINPDGRRYNNNTTDYERDVYGAQTDEIDDEIYDFNELPDEYKRIWRYLYNTQGKKAADGYWDYLKYGLDYAEAKIQSEENAQFAREDPVAADIVTTAVKPSGGVAAAGDLFAQRLRQTFTGRPINAYNNIQRGRNVISDVRETHGQDLNAMSGTLPVGIPVVGGKGLGDVYQFGMSQVDSMLNNYMTMGASSYVSNPAAQKLISWIGTSVMGSDAMAQGFQEAKETGASDEDAFRFALAQGFNETLFEHVSLEQLMSEKSAKNVAQLIKEVVVNQGFTEGSEEMSTTLANTMADAIINSDQSEYERDVREYLQANPEATEEEARRYATKKWFNEFGSDALGGFLGGLLAGGTQSVADYYQTGQTGQQMRNNRSDINARQAVRIGMQMSADSEAYQLASEINDKGIDKASNVELGRLQQFVDNELYRLGMIDNEGNTDERYDALMGEVNSQIETEDIMRRAAEEMHDTYRYDAEETSSDETSAPTEESPTQNEIVAERTDNRTMEEKQAAVRNILNTDNNVLANNALAVRTESGTKFISDIDTDNETVTLSDGTKMSVDDVKNNSDLSALLADAEDLPSFGARAMLRNYKGGNVAEYANAFRQVAEYGRLGNDYADIINSEAGQQLNAETRQIAYAVGNRMRVQDTMTAKSQGGVVRNFKRAISKSENHMLNVIDRVFRALGRTVEIVDEVDIKDADGKVIRKAGANADFNRETNTYRVAIDSVNRAFLHYAVHESIHDIALQSEKSRQGNTPTDYDIIRDAVIKHLEANGQSLESLLETQRKNHGDNTDEYYIEEIVANTVPAILSDEATLREFADRFVADDRTKNAFGKLVDAVIKYIHKLHTMMSSNSDWQQMASLNEDQLRDIREKYFTALENIRDNSATKEQAVETLNEAGFGADIETGTVYSLKYSTEDENLANVSRSDLISRIQLITNRSAEDVERFLKAEETVALAVKDTFLDFTGNDKEVAIKKNSDYPQGTIDLTNICPKRIGVTQVTNRLQEALPNDLFTADDYADIRLIMMDDGRVVACGLCFVEDRRQKLGEIAQEFIREWNSALKEGRTLTKVNAAGQTKQVSISKDVAKRYGVKPGAVTVTRKNMRQDTFISSNNWYELQKNDPYLAAAFEAYNNSRGQNAGRLLADRAEYKRDILTWDADQVKAVNDVGGLRIFSFSDFEVVHLMDLLQIIEDCAAMGVKIQGYTKQTAFAKLVSNTGIKLNRSFIPYGATGLRTVNGKRVLATNTKEGIDTSSPYFLNEAKNPNVGNNITGINDEQIHVAMLDNYFHYIIPFHSNKSQDSNEKLGVGRWDNYKEYQRDKAGTAEDIRRVALATQTYKNQGMSDTEAFDKAVAELTKETKRKFKATQDINIYTEVLNDPSIKTERQFTERFLEVCREKNIVPRFAQFLDVNEQGDYVYTPGYSKFLVDFKTFDYETGEYLPQQNIVPDFDADYVKELVAEELKKDERQRNGEDYPEDLYQSILNYIKVKHGHRGNQKSYQKYANIVAEQAAKTNRDVNGTGSVALSPSTRLSAKVDSTGATLTEAQQRYFADSKVVDDQGRLLRVYHGTNAEFYEFDRDRIGSHGSYEGAGFNFTPSEARAGGYKGIGGGDGIVMGGYLNITNPLSSTRVTMGTRKLAELIKAIDPTGDDIIANYAQNTSDYGTRAFIEREALYTARQLLQYHESDADIYADLSASGADSNAIIEAFKSKGYDGVIHYYDDGKIQTLIAFDSNQFKDVTNLNPTDSPDRRYSLKPVDPVEPTSSTWRRTIDTEEAMRRFPNLWNVTAEESETRNPTQIKSTVGTYRKIYNLLKADGFNGTILDASSGLGYGTRAGIEEFGFDVEDIEPYPDKSYKPKYTDYSKLNKQYDVIISNAVLNVIPQDQRDALVVKMGELLAPGGKMYVNVRGNDVDTLASNPDNVKIGTREWYVASTGSYQKGFSSVELQAYLKDALGDGFTVERSNKFGGVAAIVTKDDNSPRYSSKTGTNTRTEFREETDDFGFVTEYYEHDPIFDKYNNANGWVDTNGLLEREEWAEFANLKERLQTGKEGIESQRRARDGGYIFEPKSRLNNKLVYWDGNVDDPAITKIIKISSGLRSIQDGIKGWIYEYEENRYKWEESLGIIQSNYGEKSIRIQSSAVDERAAWEERKRERKNRSTFGETDQEWGDNERVTRDGAENAPFSNAKKYSEKTAQQLDQEYADAEKRGDTETAQRLVDEAARRAGYTSPLLYHGTNAFGFTVIDNSAQGADGFSFWASNKQDVSATYTGYGNTRRISEEAPDYDALWEKTNSRLNDAIHDFRLLIDRTFSEWFFGQSDDSVIYDDVVNADPEDVYDVLTEYVADAFSQYAEYDRENDMAFAEWQDSDEAEAIFEAVTAVEGARQAQLELEVDNYSGGVYALYANTDNMLDLQFNGELWNGLRPDALPKRKDNAPYRTRDIALWAREHGYSGVIFRNIRDNGDYGRTEAGDVYAFFNPNAQVKSADPFTYDDNGKLIPLSERFNAENDDIRYSEKNMTFDNDTAYVKQDTLDYWMSANGFGASNPNYAQAFITRMSPDEFLSLTANRNYRSVLENESRELDVEELRRENRRSPIFLDIHTDTGEVWSHEGRHRMIALRNAGIKSVPVLLFDMHNKYSKQTLENYTLTGQTSEKNRVTVSDAIPLNNAHRQEIEERFTSSNDTVLRFSEKAEPSNRELLANALLSITENAKERESLENYKRLLGNLNSMQDRLNAVNRKIYDIMQKKVKAEQGEMKRLQDTSKELTEQLQKYDKKLLDLESTSVLKKVLEREKRKAFSRGRAEGRTAERERVDESVQKNKFRNRIQKNVNNIYTWMAKPTDTKHVPEPIRNAVGNFIKSIDLSRTSKAGTAWRTRMDNLATQLQNGNIMREYEAFAMDLDPELALRMREFVNNNNKAIMEMSVSELQDLSQIVSALKKAITEANWMHGSIQRQYVSEVAEMSMQDFEKARKFNQSKKGKALSKIVDYNQMDAYSFFKSLGEGGMLIYNDLRAGFDNFVRRSREVVQFQESVKDMLPKKALLKKHTLDINGEKVEMTTGQIMTLYELNKREQAKIHLYNGGMFLKTDANDAYSLTPELVDSITSNLTEQEKAYADRLQNFLGNVCAAWGNEASMLMYGYRKFTDEHYFPINTAGGTVQTMNNVGDAPSDNVNMYRIANLGMTKALQANAKNPIIVESIETVFGRHASEMAEYSSYLAPLSDAMKWFNAKTGENGRRVSYYMQMAFQMKNSNGTYSDPATQWFKNFIAELNGGGTRNNAGSELWQKILGHTKAAAVGANLSVVVQQVWAYFRAYAEVDAKYMAQAFRKKPQMKLAQQYCPIAQWKAWGMFESMVSKNIEDMMSSKTTVMDQIRDKQMWLAGAADDVTWGYIWNACEAEMMDKHPNMDHTSEEFREMVGKRMSEVIDSTQVVDSIFHRPMALKNKAIQTVTAFMAEPMKSYNVLQRAVTGVAKGEQGSAKRLRNTLIGWGTAQILAAAFQSLVGAMRDDDDDETFKEKWLQKMFGEKSDGNAVQRVMGRLKSSNLFDNLNPLGMHWITKYVWQGLEEIFSKGTYGSTGIDDQLVSKAKRTLQTWQKLADGKEVKTQDIVLRTADIISTLTGVGAYNVIRDVWKLVNNVTHRAETPFFEQVEQDMANGDLTSIEEVVAQKAAEKMKKYPGLPAEKAEEEARSDVRGDFTENYKPAYIAAWFAGDDAETKRIYNLLLKSGLYGSQKDLENSLFRYANSWVIHEIGERYKTTTDENERRELRELLKRCGKSTKEIKELVEKWVG